MKSISSVSLICLITAAFPPQNASAQQQNELVVLVSSRNGGGAASGGNLTVSTETGGVDEAVTAISEDGTLVMMPGMVGQLYEVATATLQSANIPEAATTRLEPIFTLDDGTLLTGWRTVNDWSVIGGPIVGITQGLAQAGPVFENTPARVQLRVSGFAFDFNLSILNVADDDFGQYAADGIADQWQVQYFGVNHANAGPGLDPDEDGQSNLLEFLSGYAPTDGLSRFITRAAGLTDIHFQFELSRVKPGTRYVFQRSTDLRTWTDVDSFIPTLLNEPFTRNLPRSGVPHGFFRVKLEMP